MEAEIHQSLRHILLTDACGLLQSSHIDDEFVGTSFLTLNAENFEVRLESFHQVVGIQDSVGCRLSDPCLTEQSNVGIGDRKD